MTKAAVAVRVLVTMLVSSAQSHAEGDNILVALTGFKYGDKSLLEATKGVVSNTKTECAEDFNGCWMKRITLVYGATANKLYQQALPKIQIPIRDRLRASCEKERMGPNASDEAYEVCYSVELHKLAGLASELAKKGITDIGKIEAVSSGLAEVVKKRCPAPSSTQCTLDAIAWQAKSLMKADSEVSLAIGAWTIGSNLRVRCDAGIEKKSGAQRGCTAKKSLADWRSTFRPSLDPSPESPLTVQVPSKPCAPRSDRIEATVDACLNNRCGKLDFNPDVASCKLLINEGLEPYASKILLDSMSFLDADSVVFLTRAKLINQLLDSNYQATGRKLANNLIPSECTLGNKEIAEGIAGWKAPALAAAEGKLKEQLPALLEFAPKLNKEAIDSQKALVREADLTCPPDVTGSPCTPTYSAKALAYSQHVTHELLSRPAFIPASFPLDSYGIVSAVAANQGAPEKALEILRSNADAKLTESLRQACKADWIELMNMPLARTIAYEIGANIARPDPNPVCPKAEQQYPPELQAKYGKCMPWILRCLYSKPSKAEQREFISNLCIVASIALAPVAPVFSAEVGYACTEVSVGAKALAIMERDEAIKFAVSCAGVSPSDCKPETIQKVAQSLNDEIHGLATDVVTQALAPAVAEAALKLAVKGVVVSLSKAKSLITKIQGLRAALKGFSSMEAAEAAQLEKEIAAMTKALDRDATALAEGAGNDAKPTLPESVAPVLAVEGSSSLTARAKEWLEKIKKLQDARAKWPMTYNGLVMTQKQNLFSIVSEETKLGKMLGVANDGLNNAEAVGKLADDLDTLARAKMKVKLGGADVSGKPLDYDAYLEAFRELAQKDGVELGKLPLMVDNKWSGVPGANGKGLCCTPEGFVHFQREAMTGNPPKILIDAAANAPGHPEWIHAFQQLAIVRELKAAGMSPVEFFHELGKCDKLVEIWGQLFDEGHSHGVFNSANILTPVLEALGMPVRYDLNIPQ